MITNASTISLAPSRLLTLVLVAEYLPTNDPLVFRSSCKELSAYSHAAFTNAFFATRKHEYTAGSLGKLLKVSKHPMFGKAIRRPELHYAEPKQSRFQLETDHRGLAQLCTPLFAESETFEQTCQQLLVEVFRTLAGYGVVPAVKASAVPLYHDRHRLDGAKNARIGRVLGEPYYRRTTRPPESRESISTAPNGLLSSTLLAIPQPVQPFRSSSWHRATILLE